MTVIADPAAFIRTNTRLQPVPHAPEITLWLADEVTPIWRLTEEELGELGLSTSQDVLFAIADGSGPEKYLITLGYAGWEAGQLEAELADNAWLTCPAENAILFDLPFDQRLNAAAARLGINLSLLTSQAGHA